MWVVSKRLIKKRGLFLINMLDYEDLAGTGKSGKDPTVKVIGEDNGRSRDS